MIEKKFNFINYIIGFGIIVCAFLFSHLESFAITSYVARGNVNDNWIIDSSWETAGEIKYCFYQPSNSQNPRLCTSQNTPISVNQHFSPIGTNTYDPYSQTDYVSFVKNIDFNLFWQNKNTNWGSKNFIASVPVYSNLSDCEAYLNGEDVGRPFDPTLKLDDFKVNSFQWNNFVYSKFAAYWTDSRIVNVVVQINGTRSSDTFVGSSSPYNGDFDARDFANTNGDVITLIATPYDSNGAYGPSLMYSFTYKLNSPLGNVWRKIFKTPYSDHTIEIPYNSPSGNELVKLPVDQIRENNCYYVYYNPVTNQYEIKYIYNIYNYPVVVYPDDTPEEEVNETQNTIINNYNTNNYYNIVNNIYNYDISYNDISYGDISSGDVETSYKDITGFFKGFSSFFAKLLSFFAKLFPFFPAYVTVFILAALGIIISLFLIKLFITIVKGFFLR